MSSCSPLDEDEDLPPSDDELDDNASHRVPTKAVPVGNGLASDDDDLPSDEDDDGQEVVTVKGDAELAEHVAVPLWFLPRLRHFYVLELPPSR
jgi:hypothetical protein